MLFNIHQLDDHDEYDSRVENALVSYQSELNKLFRVSPEGQNHLLVFSEIGFWVAQLIYYGFEYIGVSIPQMEVVDLKEIISELFPRKISISSPDEAKGAIPELIAFWEFVGREFKLPNANAMLTHLRRIKPETFVNSMFDPAKYGMAKSFVMMGQSAGFDMSKEEDTNTFMQLYNANLLAQGDGFGDSMLRKSKPRKHDGVKEKRKRKAAEKSRRKNRKK